VPILISRKKDIAQTLRSFAVRFLDCPTEPTRGTVTAESLDNEI
jgi:hypothetical protein